MKRLTVAALALCGVLCTAFPGAAQRTNRGNGRATSTASESTRPVDGLDLGRQGFASIAVQPHSWSTVVAITLTLPGGSSADDRDLPGGAWLLGETLRASLARRLAPSAATALVDVSRDNTTFQVLAPPGAWQAAYDALLDEVFNGSLDPEGLELVRGDQLGLFRFESGAPVREFQSELYQLIAGSGTTWNRDPRGSAEGLEIITSSDLSDLRARIYRREQAAVTLVGGLDRAGSVTVHASGRGNVSSRRRGGAAWSGGRTQRLTREVTNTWIGAAFPARRDTPRTTLEFLAQRLDAELNPLLRDSGVYGASVSLEELPGGPALVVEAAVVPEERRRWEERIGRALSELEQRVRDAAFFELHKREFRNSALVADAAPETEGKRAAMDLLRDGAVRDLAAEIDALTADQVLRTLDDMGQPRILVFGPDLGGG